MGGTGCVGMHVVCASGWCECEGGQRDTARQRTTQRARVCGVVCLCGVGVPVRGANWRGGGQRHSQAKDNPQCVCVCVSVCVCVCVLRRERDSEGNQERGNPSHLFQEHLLLLVSDLHVK